MQKPEVPIRDGKYGNVKESSVHVVSISVCLEINGSRSIEYPLQLHFSGETLHRNIQSDSVSLCVYVETVILGLASLGFAGSAHWTKSSSGGRLESLPS